MHQIIAKEWRVDTLTEIEQVIQAYNGGHNFDLEKYRTKAYDWNMRVCATLLTMSTDLSSAYSVLKEWIFTNTEGIKYFKNGDGICGLCKHPNCRFMYYIHHIDPITNIADKHLLIGSSCVGYFCGTANRLANAEYNLEQISQKILDDKTAFIKNEEAKELLEILDGTVDSEFWITTKELIKKHKLLTPRKAYIVIDYLHRINKLEFAKDIHITLRAKLSKQQLRHPGCLDMISISLTPQQRLSRAVRSIVGN